MTDLHVSVDHLRQCLEPPVAIPGRKMCLDSRDAWLISVRNHRGERGLGEAAPLPGFSRETLASVRAALSAGDFQRRVADCWRAQIESSSVEAMVTAIAGTGWPPSVRFGVEQALLGLCSAARNQDVAVLLGGARPAPIPVHRRVDNEDDARAAVAAGYGTLKIKLGPQPSEVARITAIRRAVGPDVRLRLDANGSLDVDTAHQRLRALAELDIELIEEPVPNRNLEAMSALRRAQSIAIAADESCRSPRDLQQIIAAGAADAVVLKPMLIGGLLASVKMAQTAARAGLDVMVTHSLESGVGKDGAWNVAAACPPDSLIACGLDGPPGQPAQKRGAKPTSRTPGPTAVGADSDQSLQAERAGHTDALPPWHPTLVPPLASAATARPDHPALVHGGRSVSYDELRAQARAAGAALTGLDVAAGETVALHLCCRRQLAVWLHGAMWQGAAVAPLSPEQPAASLAAVLKRIQPSVVISDHPATVPAGPWQVASPVPGRSNDTAPRRWRLDETALVLTSSGSTGTPDVIPLALGQLIFSALGSASRLGLDPADRWLCCLPLHHVGGLSILLRSAIAGTTAVLHDRFDPGVVNGAIDGGQIHLVSLVPEMLQRCLDHRDHRPFPSSLRAILLGGAPASMELLSRCHAIHAPVAVTWGMTEAASQLATRFPGDLEERGDSGPPLPFTDVSTAADGRLVVSGPLIRGTELTTDDLGSIDEHGRVRVEGRRDRVIISGGENISLAEVEAHLLALPGVETALVAAIPDPRWGERPVAAVVPANPGITPQAVRDALTQRLERFKIPDRIAVVAALPSTSLGKPSAAGVLALFEQPQRDEASDQRRRDRAAAEGGALEKGMHVPHRRPGDPIVPSGDIELEADRALPQPLDGHRDSKPISQPHRGLEIGVGVDQGGHPAAVPEDGLQGEASGRHQLLERPMAVLEDSTEVDDSSGVDVLESDRDLVLERHGSSDQVTP